VPGRLRPRRFLAIEGLLKYPTVYVSEDRVSESDAWSRPGEQPADATDAADQGSLRVYHVFARKSTRLSHLVLTVSGISTQLRPSRRRPAARLPTRTND